MDLFLGVDVGGSRTRALIANGSGLALGYGETGPGNHEVVGYDGLRAAVRSAVAEAAGTALKALRLPPWGEDALDRVRDSIRGSGFGVAGFDWPSEFDETRRNLQEALDLRCPLVIRNDAALGLAAGSNGGYGINLSAGTSNNCYGLWKRGEAEIEGRIAGAGSMVGEEGGALEIAVDAVRAINHARIRRSGPTSLASLLPAATGFADADAFIEAIASFTIAPDPAWAPLVFRAAREGDETALRIIDRAGRELGESAAAVVHQIGAEKETFDLVLSGSLFSLAPDLFPGIAAVLGPVAPNFRAVRLDAPPVVGAVALGMRGSRLEPAPILAELRNSARALLSARQVLIKQPSI